jgi:NADH-quinone oxidoreductase subunit E
MAAGRHDSVNAPTNEPDEKPKGEDAQAAEATKIADDDNKSETPDGEGK